MIKDEKKRVWVKSDNWMYSYVHSDDKHVWIFKRCDGVLKRGEIVPYQAVCIDKTENVDIMDYAGYKDDFGREIYEKDILTDDKGREYLVCNDDGFFYVKNLENGDKFSFERCCPYRFFVCGNEYNR